MPLFAFLHLLVAVYFGVHVVRTGRSLMWLFVLLSFPFLGGLIYLFVEYLPESRDSRSARKALSTMASRVDPDHDVREARAGEAKALSKTERTTLS